MDAIYGATQKVEAMREDMLVGVNNATKPLLGFDTCLYFVYELFPLKEESSRSHYHVSKNTEQPYYFPALSLGNIRKRI